MFRGISMSMQYKKSSNVKASYAIYYCLRMLYELRVIERYSIIDQNSKQFLVKINL